jgi:hypothetical protein
MQDKLAYATIDVMAGVAASRSRDGRSGTQKQKDTEQRGLDSA